MLMTSATTVPAVGIGSEKPSEYSRADRPRDLKQAGDEEDNPRHHVGFGD